MTTFSEQSSAYRPVDKLREYPVNGQPLAPLSLMSIIGSAGCALRQAQGGLLRQAQEISL